MGKRKLWVKFAIASLNAGKTNQTIHEGKIVGPATMAAIRADHMMEEFEARFPAPWWRRWFSSKKGKNENNTD